MTIEQINTALHQTFAPYVAALEVYTPEQFSHKSAPDVWSLAEMYEHLYLSADFFFLANVKRCLEKRKGQEGGEQNDAGKNIFSYNSMPPMKFKVPGGNTPILTAQPIEAYKTHFATILENVDKLQETLQQDDGIYKTYHPVFGWLNAAQWYQMFEIHTRHHHRQKAELEELVSDV